jgi:hypothetical protein
MRRWCALVIVFAACGGGSSPGEPLSPDEQTSACSRYCDYRVGCGDDGAACQNWCSGLVGLIRGDAATSLLDCYTAQACDTSGENACLASTIDATAPTDAYRTALDDCTATEQRCVTSYACSETYYVLLSDDTLDQLAACFAMACSDVEPCAAAVLGYL